MRFAAIRRHGSQLLASLFLCLAFSPSATVCAVPFSFSLLVKNGDTIAGKSNVIVTNSAASINDSGDIVYGGQYSGGSGVFRNTSLVVKSGDVVAGKALLSVARPVVNDAGSIAYLGQYSGGSGIFRDGSLLLQTGQNVGGKVLNDFGGVAINDAGDIAFVGSWSGGSGLFLNNSLVYAAGSVVDGRTLNPSGIFNEGLSVSESGALTFGSFLDGGFTNVGIFVNGSLMVQNGSTVAGKLLTTLAAPSADDDQDVIFRGNFTGGSGLFSNSELLVKSGDVAASKLLTSINAGRANNLGTIAFTGFYSGGGGIFVATPIPEPSSLTLAGMGALALAVLALRRRIA